MALSASQNWDGVTAPSIPAGWNVDAQLVTSATEARSASNSLNQSTGTSGAMYWGTYATDDGSGSDPVVVTIAAWVKFTAPDLTTDYHGGVAWRGSASTLDSSTTSQYVAHLMTNPVTEIDRVRFAKVTSGTYSAIATVSLGGDPFDNDWHQIAVSFSRSGGANSTTITVLRDSDGYYLNSSGDWQAGSAACISANSDGSLTSGGYAGVYASGATAGRIWIDDWSLVSAPPSAYAIRRPNPVPRPTNAPYWI